MPNTFDRLMSGYPPAVQDLARATRALVREMLPEATETIASSARIVGYSVAPGYKGLVCTLIPSKMGVKLGIANGASLPDPAGLLEGTGNVHKYVAIDTAKRLKDPALRELMTAAVAKCSAR